ncbi:FadR/GntR family transcriptional regulator [Streptoalloteichus hindustanus]|uniref:Transcriptional regulator, GntR family n=1 Tax=Streptoalloteichus hindustanus TaxID=2017 RepID=A0A1M5PT30_STRHI|nr:FCD domain-containing protein [Streptoalloteichus hindustanus]SHH04696.1 transcriptional regulator, GntR family [Streptoalloteichus hindustanus]
MGRRDNANPRVSAGVDAARRLANADGSRTCDQASLGANHAIFRPLRTGNAFEETVERLLQAIRLGVVGPGERLPAERDLAARLHVSRVTLREAIRALHQAGYVESRRGRHGGTFVVDRLPRATRGGARGLARRLGAAGLEDVFTFRHVLETGAAEAAAARELTAAERDHLTARLAEANSADLTAFRRRDSRLHLAIAEVAGSPSLISAVADVRTRLNELLDAIPLLERNIEHSREQHERIVAAILAGDPAAARAAMAEHLAGTASLLRGFLS